MMGMDVIATLAIQEIGLLLLKRLDVTSMDALCLTALGMALMSLERLGQIVTMV
jgi:hypothetical protein